MRGLELSRSFYEEYGREMIHKYFPDRECRIAVGLFGEGSECCGYDDEISRDHDFDAGFNMWLTDEDEEEFGFKLSRAYDKLPSEYMGVKLLGKSAYGSSRRGVKTINEFFYGLLGGAGVPETNEQWLKIPSYRLLQVTNGEVFRDELGIVTSLRKMFSAMPEDVWLKKLSSCAVLTAQTGQYNYSRCLCHGETAAGVSALMHFSEQVCSMVHLLNRSYCPYYKWMFRSAAEKPLASRAAMLASEIVKSPLASSVQNSIEEICAVLIEEIKRQGLSASASDYLETHGFEINEHITDSALRSSHILIAE